MTLFRKGMKIAPMSGLGSFACLALALAVISVLACTPIEPKSRPVGYWTDVPYKASNFGCSGNGCEWNVTSDQQINYSYTVIGKTMLMLFTIQGMTVKSPAFLTIAVPGGYSVAKRSDAFPVRCYNGNSWTDGYAVLTANATVLVLYYQKGEPWPNGPIEVSGFLVAGVN